MLKREFIFWRDSNEKIDAINYIDEISDGIRELSLKVWNNPETSGNEKESANLFREVLKSNGFEIKEIPGLDHAFIGEYGSGSPVIAVLGEYDALPGLSQKQDIKHNPVEENAPGHGCGHNLLGAAALGSALREAFLANNSIKFRFHGISAHAAQSPESGRSALDAVELMNVGANYLREHVIDEARIHYTITNAGGAPNIVPKEAESWYYVRAPHRKDVEEITERLIKIAEGAALMTETTMEYEILGGTYELLRNDVLFDLTYKNMVEVELPEYTEEELEFAKEIQKTLDPKMVEAETKKFISIEGNEEVYIHQGVVEKEKTDSVKLSGSSDSGDVSWIMPMNLFLTATWPLGVPAHSWQATSASGSSLGMKGMLYAAKVFTAIAYDLLNDPSLVEGAKAEFNKKTVFLFRFFSFNSK